MSLRPRSSASLTPVTAAALLLAAGLAPALVPSAALAAPNPVIVTGEPVGPPLAIDGEGLCGASAISQNIVVDFSGLTAPTYNAGVNAFMEAHANDREESTLRTIFDLSNNNSTGLMLSYGDFLDSPGCQKGGCDLYRNDTFTPFATRLRGFLNVTPALIHRPLHFGFYADDAVSLQIFDNKQNSYAVVTRPPILGAPTWRTTNQVTFRKEGLYAIEILYVEIVEHAALEMSLLVGDFADFELPANQMGSVSLKTSGFTLLTRNAFFQTVSGLDAFPDPNTCQQCNRQFAGLPGNGGCQEKYYCNEAAVCAPCTTSLFCGETCSPCGGKTPFCINVNGKSICAPCRDDRDCPSMHCNMTTHECDDCDKDDDCEKGKICNPSHTCVPCNTSDHCAGVACNCCPQGRPFCAPVQTPGTLPGSDGGQDNLPTCVECRTDADCAGPGHAPGMKCDPVGGTCLRAIPTCNTADRCGQLCERCPEETPYCVSGSPEVGDPNVYASCVECRWDSDCGEGSFCLASKCARCVTDRRCGKRCSACTGDTPFCLAVAGPSGSDLTATDATCVRCLADPDCHGGRCDPRTHTCDNPTMACAAGLHWDGARCVECYSDGHCCGGGCDKATGSCTASCQDSNGCLGNQHCSPWTRNCEPGHEDPDVAPPPCDYLNCATAPVTQRGTHGGRGRPLAPSSVVALAAAAAAIAMALRRRRAGA